MGIERLYADGIEQAYQRGLRSPAPQVDPDFRLGSFLAAGLGGVPSAALETLGSVRDFSRGIDEQYRASPRGQIVARELEQRTGVAPADQTVMPGGEAQRMKAREFGPDPQTAHMADQVFHGLTRFGAKAVGAVVAAGPVGGAALLGTEEANTIYRDLIGRGIDSETALKVAAVQGAISAAGVVLPVSGAAMAATTAGKVGATAGLVAVGGPGSYVAQETLARDILQRAGYADEAAKHDPTDPLGLAISTLLPGAFGAVALRGALRSARPTMEDVVKHIESGGRRYDKDGNLLTSPKGAQGEMQVMPGTATDPGFGVTPARDGSPDELARVGRDYLQAMTSRYGDNDKALAAYNAGPGAVDAAVKKHDDDWLANMPAETRQYVAKANKLMDGAVADIAARSPEVADAARVKVLQETVRRSLPDAPEAYPRLMDAIDALSAGERVDVPGLVRPVQSLADFVQAGRYKAAPAVRDMDGPDTFGAWLRSQGGIDIGEKFDISGDANNVRNNPGGVFRRGGLPTDELASRAAEAGFLLPEQAGDTRSFVDLVQRMIGGDRVLSLEQQADQAVRALDRQGMDARVADLEARLQRLGEDPAAARGNPEAMEAYLAANERRLLAARVDEVADRPAADDSPEMEALRGRAQQIAQDIRDTDRTLAQYEAELQPLSPVMRRLVQEDLDAPTTPQAPYPEAAAPARGAGDGAAPAVADTGRPAADVQAAGVAKQMALQERQIVDALAAERPDMLVTLPGTNEAIPLADAMELIRAQQALDESDAGLVRAAVLCDLSP